MGRKPRLVKPDLLFGQPCAGLFLSAALVRGPAPVSPGRLPVAPVLPQVRALPCSLISQCIPTSVVLVTGCDRQARVAIALMD